MGEYLLNKLNELQKEFPSLISQARGLGLMCSFNLPTPELRNKFKDKCFEEKLIILGCGEKSIIFRPRLDITRDDLDEGLTIIKKVLNYLSSNK